MKNWKNEKVSDYADIGVTPKIKINVTRLKTLKEETKQNNDKRASIKKGKVSKKEELQKSKTQNANQLMQRLGLTPGSLTESANIKL